MRATLRAITRGSAPLLAASLVLAACGTEPEEPTDAPAATDDADAADDADAEAEQPAQEATVRVADTGLGEVLVDGAGRTLYLFDADEQGASTCYDECAANWPPLLDEDPAAGDGADDALLGTIEREDGQTQVTYDGWPLYHWIGDEQPGDVEGQGVQDVWWVVAADGQPLRDGAGPEEADEEQAPAY